MAYMYISGAAAT